uniref:Uncharacterized protein n=1 Tax=Romanomermis culicivorax TaxID=13658 RepID=A0A915HRY6_ROMCU
MKHDVLGAAIEKNYDMHRLERPFWSEKTGSRFYFRINTSTTTQCSSSVDQSTTESAHSQNQYQDYDSLIIDGNAPVLAIEEESFSTMFDSPVKKHIIRCSSWSTVPSEAP